LKDDINKKDENIIKLEKDLNDINNKNMLLKNELAIKDNNMNNNDIIINNLKSEKEKLINKIKDNKNLEESFKIQIDTLKLQIKEMNRQQKENLENNINKSDKKKDLRNQNNELKVQNVNLKYQLEYELNYNKQLKADVKNINSENEGLKLVIDKLIKEKENYVLNKEIHEEIKKNKNNIKRINTDSGHEMKIEENSNKKNKNEKTDNNISNNRRKKMEQNKSTEIKKNFTNK
jgi:chromosome segregation protein